MHVKKKVAVLLVGSLGALGATVPARADQQGADICAVAGTVHLSNGVHANPALQANGAYNFVALKFVCVGTIRGSARATSSGVYNEAGPTSPPTFDGTFQVSTIPPDMIPDCAGSLSGKRVGALMAGTIKDDCERNGFPGLYNASGAFVLTFVPDPRTLSGSGAGTIVNDAVVAGTVVLVQPPPLNP